jgi:hypothetical protein
VEVEDSDDEGLDDSIIGMIINIINIIISTVATNRQLLWLYLIFILTVLQKERSQKLESLPV